MAENLTAVINLMRILIVNVNWVGDVLFSTPAIRAVRKKYPDAFIACLVPKRCAGLLSNNPYLNEVIVADNRIPPYLFFRHWSIVSKIKSRRFDKVIFFHRSKTKALWVWASGVPERAGYAGRGREKFLTRVCRNPEKPLHKTDYFLRLLESLGIPDDGREPDFYPKKNAQSELDELFQSHGIQRNEPYIVIHAGGNWALKRWPARYFAICAKHFLSRYPWKIILCGTGAEEPLADEIRSHFRPEEMVSLCGKTSIDTLAVLLKNAKLLLSNDSGPIHLAASQCTTLVGLFGPTSPEWTGPVSRGRSLILRKDVGCEVPCYYRSCNSRLCMEWLTPEEVFQKTVEFLG